MGRWFGLDLRQARGRFRANLEIGDTEPFWEDRLYGRANEVVRFRIGEVVLEGRLAGFLAAEHRLDALKVWLDASDETRARRVAQREGSDWREVLEVNRLRHQSDAHRYRAIYGYDLADHGVYDVVLATDARSPDDLVEALVAAARARFGAAP